MKSNSCFAGLIAGVWLISVSLAGADVIFQADFKGAKGGTGGDSDLVTLGGAGSLITSTNPSGSISYSCSIQKDNPLGAGPYLHFTLNRQADPTSGPGAGAPVQLAPLSPSSAWSSLATVSNGHVLLNGGADFFVRINKATDMTMNWLRPLDFGDPKTQLRINVSTAGDSTQQQPQVIQLEVLGPDGALSGTSRVTLNSPLTVGAICHIAFSFSSTSDGKITMTLYIANGTGTIFTSGSGSNATPSATGVFQVDASKILRPDILPGDMFTFGMSRFGAEAAMLDVDYACFRIYNSAPHSFEALPTSSTPTL